MKKSKVLYTTGGYIMVPLVGKQSVTSSKSQAQKNLTQKFYLYKTQIFTAALLITVKGWIQSKCTPADEWINNMWHVHTIEYYSTINWIEVFIYVTKWTNFENLMLSEKEIIIKDHILFYFYIIFRIGKSIFREIRLVVA